MQFLKRVQKSESNRNTNACKIKKQSASQDNKSEDILSSLFEIKKIHDPASSHKKTPFGVFWIKFILPVIMRREEASTRSVFAKARRNFHGFESASEASEL